LERGKTLDNKRLIMLVEMAMGIAIAIVLSQFRLFRMPQGGSVTLMAIPLLVIAFRWGGKAGFLTGVGTGVIRLFLGAYVIHWAQFILDYPLAFSAVGLAGFLGSKPLAGLVAGGAGRFFFHFLAGMVFFGAYAPEGTPVAIYALTYNLTYMGPEILLSILTVPLVIQRISPEQIALYNWRSNAIELLSFLVPLTAMGVIVGLRDSIPAINYAAMAGWALLAIYHGLHALRDWEAAKTGLLLISVPPAIVFIAFRVLELL